MERAIPSHQIGRLYAAEIFGRIHATNAWRGNESVSGPGSDVEWSRQFETRIVMNMNKKTYPVKSC